MRSITVSAAAAAARWFDNTPWCSSLRQSQSPARAKAVRNSSTFGIGKLVGDQFEGLADIEAGESGGGEAVFERIGFVERAVSVLQRTPIRHDGARPGKRLGLPAQRIVAVTAVEMGKRIRRFLKARTSKVGEFPGPERAIETAIRQRERLTVAAR